MASKRKREEGNENEEVMESKGGTLFVSNLPYTATSVDLQTLFSDIAPVRSAFVVLDKVTRKSKGVGYVSFAIKEDAKAALESITKDGIILDKRNLRVEYADRKHSDTVNTPLQSKSKRIQPSTNRPKAGDPLAIRTICVSGLAANIDTKVLWKKFRKCEGAEKITQWPLEIESGGKDPSKAEILFTTTVTAQEAISRLHAHVFKGSVMTLVLKKKLDTLAKSGKAPSKASRLIVRNLPWNTTKDDLTQLFLPYGPIHMVTIPVDPPKEDGGQPRAKGFGFVWMLDKKDAEKALKNLNGTMLGLKGNSANTKAKERIVAVDWALSKEKWNAEKQDMEEDHETGSLDGSDQEYDFDEAHSSDDDVRDQEGEENAESPNVDDVDDFSERETLNDEDDDHVERPRLPGPDTGNTLFIRNLPYTATEDELRTLFRTFGSLRYAKVTVDTATGRSRGTGFVCFWNKEDADKVIEKADLLKAETRTDQSALPAKSNPFKISSILTPDPSSSLAQSLVLHGRTLDVTRAVTREEADRLREEGEKTRQRQDKRNLYLMREGVIFPNTPAADTLPTAEVEKRVRSFNSRRQLLRSNPSLYISKMRLSVRRIPLFATERTLKRLALHAIRTFEDDVKNGERDGLSSEELREGEETTRPKRKKGERPTAVRQAKIVRAEDRVDPVTGKGRSKGYGFLEMMSHPDALRVLRWANNNPLVEPLMREWWQEELKDILKREEVAGGTKDQKAKIKRIEAELEQLAEKGKKVGRTLILEFSIENVQVVRRRNERQSTVYQNAKLESIKDVESADSRPMKRRRISEPVTENVPLEQKSTGRSAHGKVGSIIGKKRKQKKMRAVAK